MSEPPEHQPIPSCAKYLLYFQTFHGQASPWVPDFNGVGVSRSNEQLLAFRSRSVEDLEWKPLGPMHQYAPHQWGALPHDSAIRLSYRLCCIGWARQIQLQPETLGATVQHDDGERCLMVNWSSLLENGVGPKLFGIESSPVQLKLSTSEITTAHLAKPAWACSQAIPTDALPPSWALNRPRPPDRQAERRDKVARDKALLNRAAYSVPT